jgi:hypothetical protein
MILEDIHTFQSHFLIMYKAFLLSIISNFLDFIKEKEGKKDHEFMFKKKTCIHYNV